MNQPNCHLNHLHSDLDHCLIVPRLINNIALLKLLLYTIIKNKHQNFLI